MLNEALATEIVCVLRYKRHYFMAKGIHSESVKSEFLEHANEEQAHADSDRRAHRPARRRAGSQSRGPRLAQPLAVRRERRRSGRCCSEDLVAERIAIESYREIVQWLGDKDSTTRKMMEEILAAEEEHADDLVSLLEGLPGGMNAEERAGRQVG